VNQRLVLFKEFNHAMCFFSNIYWSQAEIRELVGTDLPLYLHVNSHRVG